MSQWRVILVSVILLAGCAESGEHYVVDTFPETLSSSCREGAAKVYDECGDQLAILEQAMARAAETGKKVLVVYGAEWCIWCHAFDKYINGKSRAFSYEFEYEGELLQWDMRERENADAEREAAALNKYAADNFVVAHIEGEHSPNGADVLNRLGVEPGSVTFIPFIVVLGEDGKYLAHMPASSAVKGLEKRSDSGGAYRGYDRKLLLKELTKLREATLETRAL